MTFSLCMSEIPPLSLLENQIVGAQKKMAAGADGDIFTLTPAGRSPREGGGSLRFWRERGGDMGAKAV